MNKDFLELAESRHSVRSYSDQPIENEKLEKILRAGQVAPTAANRQPQRIYVLKSPEAMETLRSTTPFAFNAPMALLVCADMETSWVGVDGHVSAPIDATIALTQMMLEAWNLGIGSLWVRGYDKNVISQAFNLPANYEPIAIMPLGYPSEKSAPHKIHYDRKPLSETVSFL